MVLVTLAPVLEGSPISSDTAHLCGLPLLQFSFPAEVSLFPLGSQPIFGAAVRTPKPVVR